MPNQIRPKVVNPLKEPADSVSTPDFELPFTRPLPGARPKPAQKAAKPGQKRPKVAIPNDGSKFGRIRATSAPKLYREEKREKGKEKVSFW